MLAGLPWFLGAAAAFAQAGGGASSATPDAWGALDAGVESKTDAGTSPPVAPAASHEVVVVVLRGDELPREPLRAGLGKELTASVVFESEPHTGDVRGVVTIHYVRDRHELAVTWDGAGRTVSRVITAADDPSNVVLDSVLLAGNLARDQVDDLVSPQPTPLPRSTNVIPSANPPISTPPERIGSVTQPPTEPAAPGAEQPARLFATSSFFYPIATHYDRPEATSHFDLNLLYGRVGAIDGAQLGVVNVVTRGAGNGVPASMFGLQIGLLANVVSGDVSGLHAASLLNFARGDLEGIELAAGANMVSGSATGLQGAFLFNSADDVTGTQVAAVNVAGDVDGLQIGLVNVARKVRGVSVGLVNVADDIEGVPLAPISVTQTGGIHPVVWGRTSGLGNVGVKFATQSTYTQFFGSYHRAFDEELVGGGFALGGRIQLGAIFHADIDASGTYLIAPALDTDLESGETYHEQVVQPRARLLLGARMAEHFGVFVGGAAVGTIRGRVNWDDVTATIGPELLGGIEL